MRHRRVAEPAPGAHAGTLAWPGRERWLSEVETAIARRPEVLAGTVSAATLVAYCRVLAEAADHRSGRGVELTRDQIAERMGRSRRAVQYCRRAAEQLDLLRVVTAGRQLTFAERQRCAFRHRGLANTIALTTPRWLAEQQRAGAEPAAGSAVSAGVCAPPGRGYVVAPHRLSMAGSRKRPASGQSQNHNAGRLRRRRLGTGYGALTAGVAGALKVHPQRVAPMLRRFEVAGWSVGQLRDAVAAVERAPGRPVLGRRAPWARLAAALVELDAVADHPDRRAGEHRARQAARAAAAAEARTARTELYAEHGAAARERLRARLAAAGIGRRR